MRQGQQNRRGRGRSNNNNNNTNTGNRKSQNPLTRSFESTGPDVKLRGTPSHIAEKYMQLARDAHSSGDPVLAENYMQHAEHYNRIIMTFREQQMSQGGADPLANGMNRPARSMVGPQDPMDGGDEFGDDDGDEFGTDIQPVMGQGEGAPPQPVHQPRAFEHQPPQQRYDNNRPQHNNQHRNDRNDHRQGQQQNHNRNDRGDNRNDNRFDRNDRGGDRFNRNDRGFQDRGPRHDQRGGDQDLRQDRGDFNADRNGQDRGPDRGGQDRNGPDRNGNVMGAEPRGFRDERPVPQVQPQPPLHQPQPPLVQPQPSMANPASEGVPPEAVSQRRRERFQNQIRPAAVEPAVPASPVPPPEAHQPDFLRRPVRRPRAAAAVDPDASPRTPVGEDKE